MDVPAIHVDTNACSHSCGPQVTEDVQVIESMKLFVVSFILLKSLLSFLLVGLGLAGWFMVLAAGIMLLVICY